MFDGPLMLQVNWPVVDTCVIRSSSNKFALGVKIKATAESKLNESSVKCWRPD